MKLALIFERFGPYHHARLRAAARKVSVVGIEVVKRDNTYAWADTAAAEDIPFERVAEDFSVSNASIETRLLSILDFHRPSVVAVPGWFAPYTHAAIHWAGRRGARILVMSDSNRYDASRNPIKERIKRAVLAHVSSGLVAGRDSLDYVTTLGLDPERVTTRYNVVDNEHFDRPDLVPQKGRAEFLAIGRFVERKNFARLLEAYAQYVAATTVAPWPLTLAGDGPEAVALKTQAARLGIAEHVTFPGFVDYADLPALYAKASAFFLPSAVEQWGLVANEAMAAGCAVTMSRACGATRDLLLPGFNGYEFMPTDTAALARCMNALSAHPDRTRQMGEASRAIIAGYVPDQFASALEVAAELACTAPQPAPTYLDRMLFEALIRRSRSQAG